MFFRDGIEQRRREAQDESGVILIVNLPAGGCKCRDDVDVAVHRGAGVALSSPAAGDFCCGSHVDGDEDTLEFRNFEDAGGIGTELQGEAIGCLAKWDNPRERRVRRDVQG
jgi:hypothetical protein